jgi:DNA-binding CsgD family transcriptional regulator
MRIGKALWMVVSEADYLATLDLIQEAALEPEAWGKVLRQLARLTDCVAGGLTIENPQTGEGTPLAYFGFDDNHVDKTFAYYLPMNPLLKIAPLMKSGFSATNGDVIPTDEFRRTEFYDGWARPRQPCNPLTLVLHREDSVYCPLTLVRSDGTGEATDDDRALLRRLAPHLIRAMRVSMQLELARARLLAMESTLMQIAIAVLLLDRRKRVVFANPAAEKLLASGTALTTVNGALSARASHANQQLQKAILEVVGQKLGAGAEISIERERRRPLLATILPIARESIFMPFLEGTACCAVFVSDPDSVQPSRSAAIARNYGLTPAETRLLDAILSGAGLARAAEGMGISLATARTHLTRVFSKTRTGRQGELINLVMTSTSPLWARD